MGRHALQVLLAWLDDENFSGLSLDQDNKQSVLALLEGAFGPYPGSARDYMRDALQGQQTKSITEFSADKGWGVRPPAPETDVDDDRIPY
jgi:hypothetical protein